jgi:protein AroM
MVTREPHAGVDGGGELTRRARLGLVALGQTPRPDLEAEFRSLCDADLTIHGALDDATASDVARINDPHGRYPLHTRLRDGTVVDIPIATMVPLVEAQVRRLEVASDAVVVLCAGRFPELVCSVPIIFPGKLTIALARTLSASGQVGVIVPNAGQVDEARAEYARSGFAATVVHASPFAEAEVDRAADQLNETDVDLVVVECIGHGREMQNRIIARSRRSTLLAQTLAARVASEVLQGLPLESQLATNRP